ncbi:sensor histidine kinase [Clostridium sp. C105KSO13]|uniref:sensor histidine kinase n=1 Tax=Clostridium sp. C105KSO13 TaxID=1776045 RepID=UPI00074061D9|nr:HAMP domain-containing sensor histidine kinase [Clostridium sp. C105KSO13]MDV9963421.1 HAMP domain-containing sensor histidine kinase [Clostridioides difficile]CUX45059.1 Alkaline phosphatase synthesis sensor protein PhoR [Clostridium sp. C105KSO13]
MTHSIRRQMMVVFVGLIVFILVLIFAANSGFLEEYYILHKQADLTGTYTVINKAVTNESIDTGSVVEKLTHQTERANISAVVMRTDGTVIFSTVKDKDSPLYLKLLAYMFDKNKDTGKILQSTESYQIYKTRDFMTQIDYLEMWGALSDTTIFVMRSPLESIRESADLANKFLVYMGMFAIILGSILVSYFSRKITDPIKELVGLSQRMTNLDFEARYTSGGDNEIGVLGRNFNAMSTRLERTISELKGVNNQLQADIEEKEKLENMRNEFLGNVSHELKTPIALIQGYAEGLKEGVSDDPESREFYCDVIMDEANKMNQMVRNLLTLNQLEFGAHDLEFERFDVVGMIQGVITSCEILIQQAEASVDFIADEKVYVWADEFKTEQVIRNYLTNAIHHVENEKRIEIRVISKMETVRVTVFNSGKSIPKEDLGKLWDKFYKVDKAHTREYGGNGIGLSIVKAIMDSFHQQYGVNNFENGVEFWFELDREPSTKNSSNK